MPLPKNARSLWGVNKGPPSSRFSRYGRRDVGRLQTAATGCVQWSPQPGRKIRLRPAGTLGQGRPVVAHTFSLSKKRIACLQAQPHIRALTVLILETGMRSRREALSLLWNDVDLVNDVISVHESKTRAGERTIPISARCKIELLRWRSFLGPELSCDLFPSLHRPSKPMKDLRRSWAKALEDAGLPYFWQYDLRATLASRLTRAGVSPRFVAQIIGHSSTSILNTYARAIDEYRRDAIHKLETLRSGHVSGQESPSRPPNGSVQ